LTGGNARQLAQIVLREAQPGGAEVRLQMGQG